MEAMILAAGLGTRLGPVTESQPKALVRVGEKPLLGWVVHRLVASGVDHIIINAHHHEDQIEAFVANLSFPHVSFDLSFEPGGPYETGGGLLKAAPLFREDTPFLLHNADVLSTVSLRGLREDHDSLKGSLGERLVASLAVQERPSRRSLLFDDLGLMGWENRASDRPPDGTSRVREPVGRVRRLAFSGIHVVEPRIFGLTERTGAFSIITLYLELAAEGWAVAPIDVTGEEWLDVGTLSGLEEARARIGHFREA